MLQISEGFEPLPHSHNLILAQTLLLSNHPAAGQVPQDIHDEVGDRIEARSLNNLLHSQFFGRVRKTPLLLRFP
ncbi:MAG: hypothetical protein ACE5OR_06410, partial [bacterium]